MPKSAKTSNIICEYCDKSYSSSSALNRHLRETKCSAKTKEDNKKECMWCKTSYTNIQHHYKYCKADKETIHVATLNIISLKEKENEEEQQKKEQRTMKRTRSKEEEKED